MTVAHLIWSVALRTGLINLGRRVASHWPSPVLVTIPHGRKIYVDLRSSIGRGIFATGTFDMEAIRPAIEALQSGDTFVDVGANIGFYSCLVSDRVGSAGHVYSFEIDPRPLKCLKKSVAKLDYQNVSIIEAAVSNKDGIIGFKSMAEHGHNRIEFDSSTSKFVRCIRLDTWSKLNGWPKVDVIKVDVEGAEKFVLDGAQETVARYKPLLLLEADESSAAVFGYTTQDLTAQLKAMGYTFAWLDGVFTPTIVARPLNASR